MTGLLQDSPADVEPLPPSRMLLFGGSSGKSANIKEEKRLELWKTGVLVLEDKAQLLEWVEGLGSWESDLLEQAIDDPEEQSPVPKSPKKLMRDDSMGMVTLQDLRSRLLELEKTKEVVAAEGDAKLEELRRQLVAKHAELETSIHDTIHSLESITESVAAITKIELEQLDVPPRIGPTNGREAAISIAWLKVQVLDQTGVDVSTDKTFPEYAAKIKRALVAIRNETKWLSQAALAAKVMAHVTSPTQKKLLNLCYDWLRTFLPHILAKVNRVSFGLLSSKDCAAALEADAMVPQSRLKLAVPFVGKDVPSRSSEFAHPDVILGLTILGYRYSGMRYEDFADLIDAMSAEFTQEIGPARDRASSKRHEEWVLSAGGRIRGIKRSKVASKTSSSTLSLLSRGGTGSDDDNDPASCLPKQGSSSSLKSYVSSSSKKSGGEQTSQGIEVVQFKFLQKRSFPFSTLSRCFGHHFRLELDCSVLCTL